MTEKVSTTVEEAPVTDPPEINFEAVGQCPVCGNQASRMAFAEVEDYLYFITGKFRYVQCSECHLVYQDPRPIIADIPKCYANYHTHEGELLPESFIGQWSRPVRWIRGGILARKFGYQHLAPSTLMTALVCPLDALPWIRSRARCGLGLTRATALPVFSGEGRALDIGTGDGSYAAKLVRLGWRVTGVELDPIAAEMAASRYNLDIRQGTLEEAHCAADSFDFVSMFHVLEHLPAPVSTLRECYRVMKTGGRLMIRTPNYGSLTRRSFGRYWRGLEAPRHLSIFNGGALRRALRLAGFQVKKITTTPSSTSYYVRMSRQFRAAKLGHRNGKLLTDISSHLYQGLARVGSLAGRLTGDELHAEALK